MKLSKKALGLWISIVMMFSCMPMISAQEGVELHNVSLNKYAWASSSTPGYLPAAAVDGNYASEWANAGSSDLVEDGKSIQYLAVDLYESIPIAEIRFTGRNGLAWSKENFVIQIANKRDFSDAETVHTVTTAFPDNTEQIVSLGGKEARYVRFKKTDDGGLGLSEVAVMSEKTGMVNMALGKTVEAPLTYPGIEPGVVVDGMTAGDWTNAYLGSNVSYIQIDLGEDYQKYEMEEIRYLPGANAIGAPAVANANFRILVSSDPYFSEALSYEVYRNEGKDSPVTEELSVNLTEALTTVLSTGQFAKAFRYVRVTSLAVGEAMTISEISVLGRKIAGDGVNVAKGKEVTVNSNFDNVYVKTAAVDGTFFPEQAGVTRWQPNPYEAVTPEIKVDLGGEYRLNTIVFQMWGSQASNFVVQISNDAEFVNAKTVYTQDENVSSGRVSVPLEGDEGAARHIRILAQQAVQGFDTYGVSEIAAYSTDLPYTPSEQVEFLTSASDATPVTAVPENGMFAVRYKGANGGATAKNVNLIQVGYTGSVISSVNFYQMSIPAGVSALPMVQTVSVADAAGESFRFFVWEDGTLKPVVKTGTLSRA